VTLIETGEDTQAAAWAVMQKNYEATAAARRQESLPNAAPPTHGADQRHGRAEHVKDPTLIIESVFETMANQERGVSRRWTSFKTRRVLASNTSYLNIDESLK